MNIVDFCRPFNRLIKNPLVSGFRRSLKVLAIETSCDDCCVAIVDSTKRILAERRVSFADSQRQLCGISPFVSAEQHRTSIDRLVDECVHEAGIRLSDLNAFGCTVNPGLVLCLKVGVDKTLALCRDYGIGFIPVHHMRAHALVARLVFDDVNYPFLCLLVSGGHAILCLVYSAEEFKVLGQAINISPGEAIDKVARAAGIVPSTHYGSQVEQYAAESNESGLLRYVTRMPHTKGADFDFLAIKHRFMTVLRNGNVDLNGFCANLQFIVAGHLCQKLDLAFQYVNTTGVFKSAQSRNFVISGGVAANSFIRQTAQKVAAYYGFSTRIPPKELVTDNAVMCAWTTIEMLSTRPSSCIPADRLPLSVYVERESPIGESLREEVASFRPDSKLQLTSLRPDSAKLRFKTLKGPGSK